MWSLCIKKGEKSAPANYRPVSLSSAGGKVMERVVFKNMYNYLKDNNLLYKSQSGFIPGHSTSFQLIDITIIYVRLLIINIFHAWYFVTFQKSLIPCGTKDCYLN